MKKQWNWQLWTGFSVSLAGLLLYLLLFAETRAVFWPSLVLFVVAAGLLVSGLTRAFGQPELYRGKVAGSILAALSLVLLAIFGYGSYTVFTRFPAARRAPDLGQRAPEFTLPDSSGKPVSLAQLLSDPIQDSSGTARAPRGVLLVFYRGYW